MIAPTHASTASKVGPRDRLAAIIFEADDTDGVDKVRALGRRAGRELGWKEERAIDVAEEGHRRRIGVAHDTVEFDAENGT